MEPKYTQKEYEDYAARIYKLGVADGVRELRDALKKLLGIPDDIYEATKDVVVRE